MAQILEQIPPKKSAQAARKSLLEHLCTPCADRETE